MAAHQLARNGHGPVLLRSRPTGPATTQQHDVRRQGARASLQPQSKQFRLPPLTVVTKEAAVDVRELSALLAATRQNCDMFPRLSDGAFRNVEAEKLRRALQHSTVVMAIYVEGQIPDDYMQREWQGEERARPKGGWMEPWLPPISSNRSLVGFGRATSDLALTASVYDLAVAPSFQRMGIGKRILQRIVRDLLRLGISDIAVLSTDELRPFFTACGFRDDVLGSTAMAYTRHLRLKGFGGRELSLPSVSRSTKCVKLPAFLTTYQPRGAKANCISEGTDCSDVV